MNDFKSNLEMVCFWLVVLIILIAGLWPFQFFPRNTVHQDEREGLVFGKRGIAYLPNLDWNSPGAEFSMEVWLSSAAPISAHLGNAVCMSTNSSCSLMLLAQWKTNPMVQAHFQDKDGAVGIKRMAVANALPPGKMVYIALSSCDSGTCLYVDGKLKDQNSARLFVNPSHGMLVLGNNPVGTEPWQGSMAGIAIYSRSLSSAEIQGRYAEWKASGNLMSPAVNARAWFRFTGMNPASVSYTGPRKESVYVPRTFEPPQRAFLEWDARLDRDGISDMVLNFAGFVPYGFLAFLIAIRHRRSVMTSVVWCSFSGIALSAAIEITQSWMPGRSSSSTDLLFNSIGTIVGVLLAVAYFHRKAFHGTLRNQN